MKITIDVHEFSLKIKLSDPFLIIALLFQDIHILDAGCGTGHYTEALVDKGLGKVTMIDASAEMLSVAKKKLKTAIDTKVIDNVIQVKMPPLPFEDGTFDAVMFNLVSCFLCYSAYCTRRNIWLSILFQTY